MGCCLSTTKPPQNTNPDDLPPNHHHRLPESDTNGRAPPPPQLPLPPEEETVVKEVLSETPIPKPPTSIQIEANNDKRPEVQEVNIEPRAVIKPTEEIVSEVSDVSEMYSFSESFSTTTATDKREDDGEVTQRFHRSPAKVPKKRPYSGELAGGKERTPRSPARRSAPSPETRSHITSRSVQGQTVMTKRRNAGPPNGPRRDSGEGSGRRSRSPVPRGEVGRRRPVKNESPTLTTTGLTGGLSAVETAENSGKKLEKPDDDVSPETSEALENSLVSLECFIFL